MKNQIINTLFISLSASFFISCDKNDPTNPIVPSNPQEIITTAKLVLVEEGTSNTTQATWKDADGDGPAQPVITGITLQGGKTYTGTMLLLDESKTPVDTISNEVGEEADVHQFFYTALEGVSGKLTIEKLDKDNNSLPIGLQVKITTTTAANGSLKVVLKHYDGINKSTDEAVGETDVEVIFPVEVL